MRGSINRYKLEIGSQIMAILRMKGQEPKERKKTALAVVRSEKDTQLDHFRLSLISSETYHRRLDLLDKMENILLEGK